MFPWEGKATRIKLWTEPPLCSFTSLLFYFHPSLTGICKNVCQHIQNSQSRLQNREIVTVLCQVA